MPRLPVVHPRTIAMQKAKVAFGNAIAELRDTHSLTTAEEISLLADAISTITHYAIRTEREEGGGNDDDWEESTLNR